MRNDGKRHWALTGFPTAEEIPPWPFSNIIDISIRPNEEEWKCTLLKPVLNIWPLNLNK